jgi:superoxide dismutase, Fe-Mn family
MNAQSFSDSPSTPSLDRRLFLRYGATTLAASGAAAGLFAPSRVVLAQQPAASKSYTLPKLPYAYDALEPYIDAKTMTIHHDKHHQGYLDKLLAALEGHADLAAMPAEDLIKKLDAIPEEIRTAVQNNGGGFVNHNFFWKIMRPGKEEEPKGALADAIKAKFGSFASFKETFANAASTRFGSGWAWLVQGPKGLEIISTANQDSPLSQGMTPIIGLDVWEHAYYLKYQNKRPDYIAAWWNVVNWDQAEKNFAAAG